MDDPRDIKRRDFPMVRRGFEPEAVARHLEEVADMVAELRHRAASAPVAEAMSEKVRGIVEAAEQSAAEIEQEAKLRFQRIEQEKEREVARLRADADREARGYVERARASVEELLGEAADLRATLGGELEQGLRHAVENLHALGTRVGAAAEAIGERPGAVRSASTLHRERAPELPVAEEGEGEPPETEPLPGPEPVAEPSPEPAVESAPPAPEPAEAEPPGGDTTGDLAGARLVALNMALNGAPREETDRYLEQNFSVPDRGHLLDDVYARVAG